LAAGCTAVIKPSEFTSCAIVEFADLFRRAGFPDGVVNVVTGLGEEVGAALVTHPDVAHIGFTGGEAAGVRVYELAARGLKTVTLELGGKSPNIIFDDADLDQALNGVFSGIFAASGQSCQAGSRLLLQRSIHDPFVERLVQDSAAVREDPQIHRDRESRRRSLRCRRTCALGPGSGAVHRAYDLHQREHEHAHRA
jgi:acyl-CoA reductase-like NAD-dependent aldehyde dehydrogenase